MLFRSPTKKMPIVYLPPAVTAELTSKMESRCWGIAVAQFHKGHEEGGGRIRRTRLVLQSRVKGCSGSKGFKRVEKGLKLLQWSKKCQKWVTLPEKVPKRRKKAPKSGEKRSKRCKAHKKQ